MSSLQFDQEHLEYPVSPTYPAIAPPSPCRPGPSSPIDGHPEGLLTEKQAHYGKEFNKGGRSQVTIDILPDDVLLKIFDFYVDKIFMSDRTIEAWHTLVHVCRKWREVVFGSPRRLNLRLYCTHRTPVRKMLHIWPLLPIVLLVARYEMWDADEIIAVLEHNDRICQIHFHEFPRSLFETVFAATQHPFLALTQLVIRAGYTVTVPILPDSFLGGSAPQLQTLHLDGIPFLGLPKLLLSATHLIHLDLCGIPHTGYISPEAMVTGLSALTSLETLRILFGSPRSRPDWNSRCPPRLTRTLLPALTRLVFGGVSEYLEDLVARIDAPLLDKLFITFFHQLIIDTPQIAQFISRTPKFEAYDEVRVTFDNWSVNVAVPQAFGGAVRLAISSRESDEQFSSVAQVCSSSFPRALISMVENLYIKCEYWDFPSNDDIENRLWLEFLRPFTTVKDLYISWKFTPSIASALQELSGERATEVLPALQSLFLGQHTSEDLRVQVEENIGRFVSTRHLAGHPIAVSRWESQ